MSAYRMFVKDAWNLTQRAKANFPLYSGQFGEDQESLMTSTFQAYEVPSNVDVGDFCGVYDGYGRVVYSGIIQDIRDTNIEARSILSLWDADQEVVYGAYDTYMEDKLVTVMKMFFVGALMARIKNAMTITAGSSTSTDPMIIGYNALDLPVKNIYSQIKEEIDAYGIYPYISLPYAPSSNITIDIRTCTKSSVTIANNAACILNIDVGEEESFINTLIVKRDQGNGTTYIDSWHLYSDGQYRTTPGVYYPLGYKKFKIKVIKVKQSDYYAGLVQQQMPPLIHNHRITFDMLLDNDLYDFYDWELGMPMEIWKDGKYYESIMTGWQMSFEGENNPSVVRITCGTARSTLTEVLNAEQ